MIRAQLANMVTGSRIVLSVGSACFVSYPRVAFWLYAVAIVTDIIDGPIARGLKTTSTFGARLDPIADWIMGVAAFLSLLLVGWLPLWWLLVVGAPTILLTITRFIHFRPPLYLGVKLSGAMFFMGLYAWMSVGLLSRAYGWSDLYWVYLALAVLIIGLIEWPKLRHWSTGPTGGDHD